MSQATRKERCRRDNTSAAFGVGQLNKMFERVLREYPQYSPHALSSSPYVIHLTNFIAASEAAALRRACKASFHPSSDHSESVRTSNQCWCSSPSCYADPDIHNVTRRIHELTSTPYGNGENLQVVRYTAGQYYRSHHDQNTGAWTPQGPRALVRLQLMLEPLCTSPHDTTESRLRPSRRLCGSRRSSCI